MEGRKFSSSRAGRHLRARLPGPLRRRTRCATSSRWPARRTRTPTSPGRSSCAATTTSSSPAGATWSTGPISMVDKNFGAIPAAGELTDADRALLATDAGGLRARVGDLIEQHRQKQAISEAMRVVGEANKYLSDQAPWKLKDDTRSALGTVLHVAPQVVSDCNTLLTPFLPHSAQTVHEVLGGTGGRRRCREIDEVDDLDGGPATRCSPATTAATCRALGVACRSSPGTPVAAADPGVHEARPLHRGRGAGAARRGRGGERAAPMPAGYPPLPEPLPRPGRRQPLPPRPGRRRRRTGRSRSADALAAAASVGVTRMVQIGCDLPSAALDRRAVDAARRSVLGGVALHPNEARALAAERRARGARGGARRDRTLAGAPAGPGRRRDRSRPLPHRTPDGRRGAAGVVPPAHRAGEAARHGAADPRPGRARRRPARPRGGGRAGAHGLPLLLRRRRDGPGCADRGWYLSFAGT